MFKSPTQLIKQYLNLPKLVEPWTEELSMQLTHSEWERKNQKKLPKQIVEYLIGEEEKSETIIATPNNEKSYDEQGRLITEFNYINGKHLNELFRYDHNNNLIEYFKRYLRGELDVTTFQYNKSNLLTQTIKSHIDPGNHFSNVAKLVYNDYNLLTEILEFNSLNEFEGKEVLEYSPNNLLISRKSFKSNGESSGLIEYNYNSSNFLAEEVIVSNNNNITTKYDYDNNNNLIKKSKIKNQFAFETYEYVYTDKYLTHSIIQSVNENGYINRKTEWKVSLKDFAIDEITIQRNEEVSNRIVKYDTDWLPLQGNQISFGNEYELRFDVITHHS